MRQGRAQGMYLVTLVTLVTLSLVHPSRGPIAGFVMGRQSPPSSTAFGSHSRAGPPNHRPYHVGITAITGQDCSILCARDTFHSLR